MLGGKGKVCQQGRDHLAEHIDIGIDQQLIVRLTAYDRCLSGVAHMHWANKLSLCALLDHCIVLTKFTRMSLATLKRVLAHCMSCTVH